jgi:hypothetical protein
MTWAVMLLACGAASIMSALVLDEWLWGGGE